MITYLLVVLIICFGVVLFFGAPYLPTRRQERLRALELLKLKPGQTLLELGSGDGSLLIAAAKSGLKVVGYELNPILVLVSYLRCFKYRKNIRIIWGNFWRADLSNADGVYVFLLDRFMTKLDAKLTGTNKELKLVSYAFAIPGRKVIKKTGPMSLYHYQPIDKQH